MPSNRVIELLLLSAPLLFGQLDSNSITITATRSTPVQPDLVIFAVTVGTPAATTLDDVVAALQGTGITASQLSGGTVPQLLVVTGLPLPITSIGWNFTVPEPLSKIKDTIASLMALQKPLADKGMSLGFAVAGTQASTARLASQPCSNTDLIADATAQAQKLTTAAGLGLGPILGLTGINATPPVWINTPFFATSSLIFDPLGLYIPSVTQWFAAPQTCSLTVKFAVTL